MRVPIFDINSNRKFLRLRDLYHWNKNKRCRKYHKCARIYVQNNNLLDECDFEWFRWFVNFLRRFVLAKWCTCSFIMFFLCKKWPLLAMEFEIIFQVVSTYNACGDGDGIIGIGTRSHTCWQSNSWRIILVVVFVIIMYITYGIALKFGKHSTQKKRKFGQLESGNDLPNKNTQM